MTEQQPAPDLSKADASGCLLVGMLVLLIPFALVLFALDQPVAGVGLLVGGVGAIYLMRWWFGRKP